MTQCHSQPIFSEDIAWIVLANCFSVAPLLGTQSKIGIQEPSVIFIYYISAFGSQADRAKTSELPLNMHGRPRNCLLGTTVFSVFHDLNRPS